MIIIYQSSAGTERKVWYCVEKNHKTDEMRCCCGIQLAPKAYVVIYELKAHSETVNK